MANFSNELLTPVRYMERRAVTLRFASRPDTMSDWADWMKAAKATVKPTDIIKLEGRWRNELKVYFNSFDESEKFTDHLMGMKWKCLSLLQIRKVDKQCVESLHAYNTFIHVYEDEKTLRKKVVKVGAREKDEEGETVKDGDNEAPWAPPSKREKLTVANGRDKKETSMTTKKDYRGDDRRGNRFFSLHRRSSQSSRSIEDEEDDEFDEKEPVEVNVYAKKIIADLIEKGDEEVKKATKALANSAAKNSDKMKEKLMDKMNVLSQLKKMGKYIDSFEEEMAKETADALLCQYKKN